MKRALVVLALLVACKGEQPASSSAAPQKTTAPPPSVAAARDLIAGAAEFGDFEFTNAAFTTPVDLVTASTPAQESVKQLEQAGWLQTERGKVELTEKSRADKRFLMRPNGMLDVVPVAKKEMGDVSAVTANGDGTVSAAFTWRWVANDVGSAFTSGPLHERFTTPRTSKATLIWDGSTWSVLKIE
jgi:hypothetical protein